MELSTAHSDMLFDDIHAKVNRLNTTFRHTNLTNFTFTYLDWSTTVIMDKIETMLVTYLQQKTHLFAHARLGVVSMH